MAILLLRSGQESFTYSALPHREEGKSGHVRKSAEIRERIGRNGLAVLGAAEVTILFRTGQRIGATRQQRGPQTRETGHEQQEEAPAPPPDEPAGDPNRPPGA